MTTPMTDVRAIVPYRAGEDGSRRRNAQIVLGWLADGGVPTILVEHSDAPDLDLRLPAATARLHLPANGAPFSKAIACNAGFREAGAPVIAFVDADTLTAMPALLACVGAVRDEYDAIRPFGRLVELDEQSTLALAEGAALPEARRSDDDDRGGEQIPLCGGIVIVRAEAYRRVGGMDESFQGWGGEDDALSAALTRSRAKRAILDSMVAFHLNHPRSLALRYLHPDYERNVARARWWHEASDDEIADAMVSGATRLM